MSNQAQVMHRRWVLLPILLLGAVVSSHASAGLAARLVYLRSGTAESCPDQAALKTAVARRLGYDPFFVAASYTIVAEMSGSGGELRARARLLDDAGIVQGSRELLGKSADCSELLASLALAISLTLDPMAALSDAPSPPVADSKDVKANASVPSSQSALSSPSGAAKDELVKPRDDNVRTNDERREDASAEHDSILSAATQRGDEDEERGQSTKGKRREVSRMSLSLLAGALGSFGFVPATSPALSLGLLARKGNLGLELEGATVYAQTKQENGLEAEVSLNHVSVVPCYFRESVGFCGLASLGRYSARGSGVDMPRAGAYLHGAAGLRFLGSIPLAEQWSLKMAATGVRVISRPWFVVAEQKVYRPSDWAASLGVFLAWQFF